jgi:hypothetical protein
MIYNLVHHSTTTHNTHCPSFLPSFLPAAFVTIGIAVACFIFGLLHMVDTRPPSTTTRGFFFFFFFKFKILIWVFTNNFWIMENWVFFSSPPKEENLLELIFFWNEQTSQVFSPQKKKNKICQRKKTLTLTFPLTKSDEDKKTIVKSANHPLCFEPLLESLQKWPQGVSIVISSVWKVQYWLHEICSCKGPPTLLKECRPKNPPPSSSSS